MQVSPTPQTIVGAQVVHVPNTPHLQVLLIIPLAITPKLKIPMINFPKLDGSGHIHDFLGEVPQF